VAIGAKTTRLGRSGSLLALGGVALGLAGCGGGGSLSHAQFVSRADAECRATNTRIAALPTPSNLKGLAGYATGTRSATAQLRQALSALETPKSDQPALGRYLAALDQGNAILARISTAAAAGESASVSSLGKELAALPTSSLASKAGLPTCAADTGSNTTG
jgi:hypothetical protein